MDQAHAPLLVESFPKTPRTRSQASQFRVQMPWNQAHAPLLVESFPKTPRTRSQASQFGGSHNYKRKQTTFTDRLDSVRHLGSLRETLFGIVDDFFPQVLKCLL
jgi:hypothetical protein